MSAGIKDKRTIIRASVWRIAWTAILLMHVPAISNDASGTDVLVLYLSLAVLLIEILFCPLLSICSSPRGFVVLVVVIALLHVGLIDDQSSAWSSNLVSFSVIPFVVLTCGWIFRFAFGFGSEPRRLSRNFQHACVVSQKIRIQTFLTEIRTQAPPYT